MAVLTRRFEKLKSILNCRMSDLTVVLEEVNKPHNLSAILRSCDAVGALEAHVIKSKESDVPTFNSTAQGSQKWVKLNNYISTDSAIKTLKKQGFKFYGTVICKESVDYRKCDFTGPTAFFLGAEKWGLKEETKELMDQSIFIPMRGMVQSLNVSVAAATLLFEALRQREEKGLISNNGEGLSQKIYEDTLFEWTYPEVASSYKEKGLKYPKMNETGEIIETKLS